MTNSYQTDAQIKYDEFIAQGIFSINPAVSSLQEIILIYLKELAYYLLKLKDFGATNDIIKDSVIEAISGMIANVDYNQVQFQKIITILANNLNQAKLLYKKLCAENKQEEEFLKVDFKHPKEIDINEIIKRGERCYIKRNMYCSPEQKNLFDIIVVLIKRICMKIIQIKSYNKDYEKAYETILILLNTFNFEDISTEEIKSIIQKADLEYYNLLKTLYEVQEAVYGPRESVYIPFSPRAGKAILVSGIDMTQLEAVLNATKNKGVDVYTHGRTMLMAHTLSKFREYPHLVGHFGKDEDNSLFDFAAFPGAILMTRYLFQKVQYLYKGRLFTTDNYAPAGIVKIKDNNFEPLIKAALCAKGFTKKQQEVIERVGFRRKVLEDLAVSLTEKMEKNEIRHLFFIGVMRHGDQYKDYFNKFFELLPKDCYAISLSAEKNEENVLHVDSFYDHLLIYQVLQQFNEIKPINQLNITIYITKCDQYTITNIINFINMGVKNIYMCNCIPTIINPAMADTIKKIFGIKSFSTPEHDLEEILSNN